MPRPAAMDDLDRLYHRLLDAVREGAPHLRERRFRLGDIPQHLLPYRLHRRELGFESVQQYERALARLAAGERGYLSAAAGVHDAFRRVVDGAAAVSGGDAPPLDQLLRQHGDAPVALAPDSRHRADSPAPAPAADVPVAPDRDVPDAEAIDAHTAEMAVPAGLSSPERGGSSGPEDDSADTGPLVIPIVRTEGVGATPPLPRPTPSTPASLPAPASSAAMPFPVRPPTPVVGGACPHCARPLPTDRGVTFCPYCGENLTVRRCPACSTELEAGWRFCITCGREVDAPSAAAPAGDGS